MSVFSSSRLAGKTVFITGASSGIGAATAILFARAGANLILTARRQTQLDAVATEAKKANLEGASGKGGQVFTLTLDMQDKEALAGVLAKLPKEFSKVDILVNNAGMVFGKEQVGDIAEADVEAMFNTNVIGLITLTQIFVRGTFNQKVLENRSLTWPDVAAFKAQHSGHIIMLGSIAGKEPYAGGAIYTATKHAVSAFTGSMARELVNTPIRVTQVRNHILNLLATHPDLFSAVLHVDLPRYALLATFIEASKRSNHLLAGMVETEFSVVRFRGDKDAADKVYENVQPLVAQDIAEEIVWAASRPDHVNIADVLIFPKCQASAGIVHRGALQ
ncbi:hypothetical protein P7C70_g4009, partial [Phenoliferia sp. Uapishka_3]